MPSYPIVGMDGTENPRKSVRLRPLALTSGGGIADTIALGAIARKSVRVQVPPRGL